MSLPVASLWVNAAATLQRYPFLNRGVLDVVGMCPPVIALARNKEERREKWIDRAIVIGAAFVFAPIHARLFLRGVSKRFGVPKEFVTASSKCLKSTEVFKHALTSGQWQQWVKTPKRLATVKQAVTQTLNYPATIEAVRKKIVRAKAWMMIPDVALEALILGNAPFFTNFVTRKLTGKGQFTGEKGAVSDADWDALYQDKTKAQRQQKEKHHLFAMLAAAVAIPMLVGLGAKRALLQGARAKGFGKTIQKAAHWFDYKLDKRGWAWMSLPSLAIVVGMQFAGYLSSARSPREFKERFLREAQVNTLFFLGEYAWLGLLAHTVFRRAYKKLNIKPTIQIQKAVKQSPKRWKPLAAKRTAAIYWLAFLLNSASVSASVIYNNWLTTKQTQHDALTARAKTVFNKLAPAR